jgi:hypothetical protein
VTENVHTCPSCRLAVTADARFCPNCGTRLDGETGAAGSISYSQPETRLFGVLAPVPTFVLACVLLAGSLISLVAQSWILGVMLLAFAAALFVLFYGAAERDPESGVARAALGATGRVSGWARFAVESAGAWSGAGRRVLHLRRELRPLRAERKQVQLALGEAAYRQDEPEVASLRARMAEIDDAIAARERESAEALASARSRVEDERLAVTPTQHLATEQPTDQPDEQPADQPDEQPDESR